MIIIVRHGESEANAGMRCGPTAGVRLTAKGLDQAGVFARGFGALFGPPTRIVVSRYLRSAQSAEPLRLIHTTAKFEVWNVHEFSYLPGTQTNGTSKVERAEAARDYWTVADPRLSIGGAETFCSFISRVDATIDACRSMVGTTVLFTHSDFMLAMRRRVRQRANRWCQGESMTEFRAARERHGPTPNMGHVIFLQAFEGLHEQVLSR